MESASERYYARVQKPLTFMTEEGLKLEMSENMHFSDATFVFLKTLNLQSTFSLMKTFRTGRDSPS